MARQFGINKEGVDMTDPEKYMTIPELSEALGFSWAESMRAFIRGKGGFPARAGRVRRSSTQAQVYSVEDVEAWRLNLIKNGGLSANHFLRKPPKYKVSGSADKKEVSAVDFLSGKLDSQDRQDEYQENKLAAVGNKVIERVRLKSFWRE
jgi:hypothetical protein